MEILVPLGGIVLLVLLVTLTYSYIIGVIILFVNCFSNDYGDAYSNSFFSRWGMRLDGDNHLRKSRYPLLFERFINLSLPLAVSLAGPLGGLFLSWTGSPHTRYDDIYYTPISHEHFLTISVLYLVSVVAYWMSKRGGEALPPLLRTFALLGMGQGILLCLALSAQLGAFVLVGLLPLGVTFPAISPVLYLLLLIVEIKRQFHLYRQKRQSIGDPVYESLVLGSAEESLSNPLLENPLVFTLLAPFIAVQLALLTLFGQRPDSAILAFLETTTYTFSQHLPPPQPPEGHYLCTIAARGHRRLVKPLRLGSRGGRHIWVNRQLMVANAFEEWLQDHTPRFHKRLRAFYNKIGRPLNAAVKNQWMSDFFYVLMKPLEWFFLIWLYVSDAKPENRIQRQYLPKPKDDGIANAELFVEK